MTRKPRGQIFKYLRVTYLLRGSEEILVAGILSFIAKGVDEGHDE
jgi:hypothetical protein